MKEFISYLQSKNLSKATQKAYLFSVEKFLKWFGKNIENRTQTCAELVEAKDIINYLEHLQKEKKQSNTTRKYNLYALQHYFTFLVQNDVIAKDPTAFIKIRGSKTRKLPKLYTPEQLGQLYDNYHNIFIRSFNQRNIPKNQQQQSFLSRERNYTMLGFLVYQGLVTSEFDRLKLTDIDFAKATVKITGKTKATDRKLPLMATQIGALMNYTQNIRPQFLSFCQESEKLFFALPSSGKSFTKSSSIISVFKPLTKQLRTLEPDFIKVQQLRASKITHWLKTEGLRKTQYLAGHKSIVSTEAYLPNDLEQLTNDISQYNPF